MASKTSFLSFAFRRFVFPSAPTNVSATLLQHSFRDALAFFDSSSSVCVPLFLNSVDKSLIDSRIKKGECASLAALSSGSVRTTEARLSRWVGGKGK